METRQEITIRNSKGEEKVVKRVTLKQAEDMRLKPVGSGAGICVEYCAWLGSKYEKNFFERADYFAIIKEVINEGYKMKEYGNCLNEIANITVAFYSKPENSDDLKGGKKEDEN